MTTNNIASKADRLTRHFARSTDGNVAMIFGFTLLVLTACIGGAVDYGRWLNINRHTQNAVDGAVIAASRVAQQTGDPAKALATANEYYAQAKSQFGASDTVTFIPDPTKTNGWKVSGQGAVPTPFLSVIGITELPVKPKAAASVALGGSGDSSLEISLVLDVTGSMCINQNGSCTNDPKIKAVKEAAIKLVDTVVPTVQTASTSRVAVVPFSGRIRVAKDGEGAQLMKTLTNLDKYHSGYHVTDWPCSGPVTPVYHQPVAGIEGAGSGGGWWDECLAPYTYGQAYQYFNNYQVSPCVTARSTVGNQWTKWVDNGTAENAGSASDDAPGANYWLNANDGGRFPKSENSLDIAPSGATGILPPGITFTPGQSYVTTPWDQINWAQPLPLANVLDQNWFWSGNYEAGGACWGVPNTNVVMPLTSDKDALKTLINGLTAEGQTAGPEATQWGWFMLSPKWANIWPTAPAPYSDLIATTATGAPKVKKIAIIMSDGVYNNYRSQMWYEGYDQYDWAMKKVDYSTYARKVCENMKAAGITIYTIGFGLNELPEADRELATTTLEQCSTSHRIQDGSLGGSLVYNFYDANTTGALQSAFTDIGQQLTKLRLTE
jgi:hypothetical protein